VSVWPTPNPHTQHSTHTWQSWRNRYVKDEARINSIIERLNREEYERVQRGEPASAEQSLIDDEIRPKRKLTKKPGPQKRSMSMCAPLLFPCSAPTPH
jgi:hypothetical protein